MFPLAFVAHAAALTIRQCVTREVQWQGGQARLDEGEFMVYVSASGDKQKTAAGVRHNETESLGLRSMEGENVTVEED